MYKSVIEDLPTYMLTYLLQEWIDLKDLMKLNSAICFVRYKPFFNRALKFVTIRHENIINFDELSWLTRYKMNYNDLSFNSLLVFLLRDASFISPLFHTISLENYGWSDFEDIEIVTQTYSIQVAGLHMTDGSWLWFSEVDSNKWMFTVKRLIIGFEVVKPKPDVFQIISRFFPNLEKLEIDFSILASNNFHFEMIGLISFMSLTSVSIRHVNCNEFMDLFNYCDNLVKIEFLNVVNKQSNTLRLINFEKLIQRCTKVNTFVGDLTKVLEQVFYRKKRGIPTIQYNSVKSLTLIGNIDIYTLSMCGDLFPNLSSLNIEDQSEIIGNENIFTCLFDEFKNIQIETLCIPCFNDCIIDGIINNQKLHTTLKRLYMKTTFIDINTKTRVFKLLNSCVNLEVFQLKCVYYDDNYTSNLLKTQLANSFKTTCVIVC